MAKLIHNRLKISLTLLGLGLFGLILWRLNQPVTAANLLTNSDFASGDLSGWQIARLGPGQATTRASAEKTRLALEISEAPQGNWIGVGQRLSLEPLQRYRLRVNYRLAEADERLARVILRVVQFDGAGQVIKSAEVSSPEPLVGGPENGLPEWNTLQQTFVTAERVAEVEIGLGLLGQQATRLEIDEPALERYPTSLDRLGQDRLALIAVLILLGLLGYGLSQVIWPARRQILINSGLVVASVALTLIAAEILVRFIPVNLISPNWPTGYHISYMGGKSYRLAADYPATYITDNEGDRHLVVSNSLGVRDVELPLAPNQSLVLVLGDSMTFGWAVSDINDTWTRRLDAEIDQRLPGSNYHFINAGVSGYNTFQEVYLFEVLVKEMAQKGLKPRIAMLSFFSGIWERNLYGPEGRFSILNGAIMYTSVKQALLELAGRLIDQSSWDDLKLIGPSRLNPPHQILLARSRLYFLLSLLLVNQLDENWNDLPAEVDPQAVNFEAFRRFKEVAAANGIEPIVAYLPSDNLFTPGKLAENQKLVEQLAEICRALDLPFINPYDNMKKLGINEQNAKEKLTLVYNRHYNAAGNLLYARALAPLLADYLAPRYSDQ